MVRDLDIIRNALLTVASGSSGTPGFLTEEDSRRKVERLKEAVLARTRKGGRAGGGGGGEGEGGPSNGEDGGEEEEEGGEGDEGGVEGGGEAQGGEEGIGEE